MSDPFCIFHIDIESFSGSILYIVLHRNNISLTFLKKQMIMINASKNVFWGEENA